MSNYLWILNAGHGGIINGTYQTAGKRSPIWDNGRQYFEGIGNRMIVNEIIRINEEKVPAIQRLDIINIARSQKDISLKKRIDTVNLIDELSDMPQIYISNHSNACDNNPDCEGWSAWTSRGYTPSDIVQEYFYQAASKKFPNRKILRDFNPREVRKDSDYEAGFYELKYTNCPAVLLEHFFMTNYKECNEILLSPQGIKKIAGLVYYGMQLIEHDIPI